MAVVDKNLKKRNIEYRVTIRYSAVSQAESDLKTRTIAGILQTALMRTEVYPEIIH